MHRLLQLTTISLLSLGYASAAQAQHDVRVFLSSSGIDFIEENAHSYVPSVIEPPTISKSFACMDFEQRDTVVNMSLDRLNIELPADDRIRIDLDFSLAVNGELYADDIYACFGEATCQDSLNVEHASAVFDFDLEIVNGQPRVQAREVSLDINPDDFAFNLDGCGFTGTALTAAVNFAEGWILDFVESKVSSMGQESLAPMLENVLSGLSMDGAYFSGAVEELGFPNSGVALTIEAGITEKFEPAACVAAYDVGGPASASGSVPNIQGPAASDVNLALNVGLLNQALYAVWHRGLLCLTDRHLAALGVHLDLEHVGALLPGFPPGTKFSFDLAFTDYPRVTGAPGDGLALAVGIEGLVIDLHGDRPDGTRNTLHAEISVEAVAQIAVNPATNAIYAQLKGAEIKRMVLEDERKASGEGYDVPRIKQLVHEGILPSLIDELGPIPVTASVFAVPDHAVLLRQLGSSAAYIDAGVDLFRIPENDKSAPDTQIIAPSAPVNPHNAIVQLGGSDGQIPEELLQYQIKVDGIEQELNFMREVKVGESGRTATYQVQVAAVDLAGNIDPSPATASVMVDGITPLVVVEGRRVRSEDEGPLEVRWTMSDDVTAIEGLKVRVDVQELVDPADVLSAQLIDSQELEAGATSTVVDLSKAAGGVYRIEVHVTDAAGNDSQSTLLLSIASAGGCNVGGRGGNGAYLLLLALGFLAFSRRRARHINSLN